MKRILDNCSKRFGMSGWCLVVKGLPQRPCDWSLCTTRKECRELLASMTEDMHDKYEIVKVKVELKVI